MRFLELVQFRQSTRKYTNKKIEQEKLLRCLEAARLAPSASNSQPWTWLIVDDEQVKLKVGRETYNNVVSFNRFVKEAPVIAVIVLEKAKPITRVGMAIKKKEWPLIDIGITADHFCLQAAEEGLGTCMLGWFNEKAIKEILAIPESKSIALLISVGYPPENYKLREKTRKPIEGIVRYNKY